MAKNKWIWLTKLEFGLLILVLVIFLLDPASSKVGARGDFAANEATGSITIVKSASPQDGTNFSFIMPTYLTHWGSEGQANGQFNHPNDVAVDRGGNVFVADTQNDRIQKFDSDGNFVLQWGVNGSDDGQFQTPIGIAVDISGYVYVADAHNRRIQKFDNSGSYVLQWGEYGSGDGQFDGPIDVAVDGLGNVYVIESTAINQRVQKFDSNGNFLLKWGEYGYGDGQFVFPVSLAVDGQGNVYVGESGRDRIHKFDGDGNYLLHWGESGNVIGNFDGPNGIAVDGQGYVYVSDEGNNRIQIFDSYGNYVLQWGLLGSGNSQFNKPQGVELNSGYLYVADSNNHRIQKFQVSPYLLDDASPNDGDAVSNSIIFNNLIPGSYEIAERPLSSWKLSGIICNDGESSTPSAVDPNIPTVIINVDPGENVICTFNSQQVGSLTIEKSTIPQDGTNFSFDVGGLSDLIPPTYSAWWPVNEVLGIGIDGQGYVYVSNSQNGTIRKYSSNGNLDDSWLGGYFGGLAVDNLDNIYVTDTLYNKVNKFDSSGNFLVGWGEEGNGNGQFDGPNAVAAGDQGAVYVADTNNHRIQKFDNSGNFLLSWGVQGTGAGQFNSPAAVVVDAQGNVFVADTGNYRIQKFDSSGIFLVTWGSYGTSPGRFKRPKGLSVDAKGDLYVSDSGNNRIQKFDNSGRFLIEWGTGGTGNGQFSNPLGLVVDDQGDVYIADAGNSRVQKFKDNLLQLDDAEPDDGDIFSSSVTINNLLFGSYEVTELADYYWKPVDIHCDDGASLIPSRTNTFIRRAMVNIEHGEHVTCTFDNRPSGSISIRKISNPLSSLNFTFDPHNLTPLIQPLFQGKYGSYGTGNGQFRSPRDVAVDTQGNSYVADWENNRIQKFDSNGAYLLQWGGCCSGDGQFNRPNAVAVDEQDQVFVVDSENKRIQKFMSNGAFLLKWGDFGSGDGQFRDPSDIAVDTLGNVYVVDSGNQRIQKFDNNGSFLLKWGTEGGADGEFNNPLGILLDGSNNVYVVDSYNSRVQKFDNNGNFLQKWGIYGSSYGQFVLPRSITMDEFGYLYVLDSGNNRIQKFTSDGIYLLSWGEAGSGDGQFDVPQGMAVDPAGILLVADANNHRIQKFHVTNLVLDYSNPDDGDEIGSSVTYTGLDPGAYQVSEEAITGWYLADISCFDTASAVPSVPDVDNRSATINLELGEHVVCTFRNEKYGNIIITKSADPPDNSNFTFDVSSITDSLQPIYLNQWGEAGSGEGQFSAAAGVAVDKYGNTYVVDSGNQRIQKFDRNGDFLLQWGSLGTGDGEFSDPLGVAVDVNGYVFVADGNNNRVQKFDSYGNFIMKWGESGTGDGQFNYPTGILVDGNGHIFVSEFYNHRLQKFDSNGNFLLKWGSEASAGSEGGGYFKHPTGLMVDGSNFIYVADHYNHRIQKFDNDGNFLLLWGDQGTGDGQFVFPNGGAVDIFGHVYVVDSGNNRLQKFDDEGNFILSWGGLGSAEGEFDFPFATAVDGEGNLYVSEINNQRIQKFQVSYLLLDDTLGEETDDNDNVYASHWFPDLAKGYHEVGEETLPGWILTDIQCNEDPFYYVSYPDPTNNRVNIGVNPGEWVFCTFFNEPGQEIVLAAGWNSISGHVLPNETNLETLLAPILDDVVMVKNGAGEIFWPDYDVNQIGTWDELGGLQIYVNSARRLKIPGTVIDPLTTSSPVNAGWNLVGYWRLRPMDAPTALDSIATQLVLAKNGNGQIYWPDLDINTIVDLWPGEGYQLNLDEPGVLSYPDN